MFGAIFPFVGTKNKIAYITISYFVWLLFNTRSQRNKLGFR